MRHPNWPTACVLAVLVTAGLGQTGCRPAATHSVAASSPAPVASPAAESPADTAGLLAIHRAWWQAFTYGDTSRLATLTAPAFTLTMSTGRTLDRGGALADALNRDDSTTIHLDWADDVVESWGPTALVTSRFTERSGPNEASYRFLSLLRRAADGWQLVAAQSTRLPPVATPVPVSLEVLRDYAGRYQQSGRPAVEVVLDDARLMFVAPSRPPAALVPLSSSVFQLPGTHTRLVFDRTPQGQVTALIGLTPGSVTRWTRLP
jgi:hypothetical protein